MNDNIWHVFPVDDLKEHIIETEWKTFEYGTLSPNGNSEYNIDQKLIPLCECNPTIQEVNDGFIVIHNSFDGREGI